jgi:putative membrane protein
MLLVRVLINGLSLLVAAALLPHIYLVERSLLSILLLGAILGLLNAIVRPILQFLTLSFIFVTYGLVVVMINTVILLLLSMLLPNRIGVDSLFWAMIAGAVIGILAGALESLLGLSFPILPDGSGPPDRRSMLEARLTAVPTAAGAPTAGVLEEAPREAQPELPQAEALSAVGSVAEAGSADEIPAREDDTATEQGARAPSTGEE